MLEIGPSDARVRRREARRPGDSRAARARRRDSSTTLDGQTRTLDETMLVIADRERAVAIAGVMGGADVRSLGAARRGSRSRAPGSCRRRCARRAGSSASRPRPRRGSSAAPTSAAPVRGARGARCALLAEDRRAARASAPWPTSTRAPAEPRTVALRRARVARLLGDAVPDGDVERILDAARLRADGRRRRLAGRACRRSAWTSRAKPISSRKSAGTGASTGFRRRFPRAAHGAAARRRPASRADRAVRRLLCGAGLQEAVDVHVHRGRLRPRRSLPDGDRRSRSPTRSRRSSRCCARRSLPGLARRRSSTTGGASRTTSGSSRSARSSRHRRRAPARRLGADRRARPTTGAAARGAVGLLRREGRRRARSRRRSAPRSTAEPADDLPWFVPRARGAARRSADGAPTSAGSAQLRRDLSRRAASAQPTRSFGGEIDLAALDAARRRARRRIDAAAALPVDRPRSVDRRRRTLASRRGSWHDSGATRRRRSSPCASSIGIRARACRTARSACRSG